jgi:hypothetical protein
LLPVSEGWYLSSGSDGYQLLLFFGTFYKASSVKAVNNELFDI